MTAEKRRRSELVCTPSELPWHALVAELATLDPYQDEVRRAALDSTFGRLAGGGVDLRLVTEILRRAHIGRRSHAGWETLSKGMGAQRVERDRTIRDLRAALARLLHWIRRCSPHWGRRALFGPVLVAAQLLKLAIKENSVLSTQTDALETGLVPSRRPSVGRPLHEWTNEARQMLKVVPLDDATVVELLWAAGLVKHDSAK